MPPSQHPQSPHSPQLGAGQQVGAGEQTGAGVTTVRGFHSLRQMQQPLELVTNTSAASARLILFILLSLLDVRGWEVGYRGRGAGSGARGAPRFFRP